MVGGLDPAGIDYAIEESLETIFDLAEEFQVGIDIHLHDTGKWAFIQLINFRHFRRTKIYSANRYQSRLCAARCTTSRKRKLYQRLATHQTAIMSTIPYDPRYLLPPIDVLRQAGVSVHLGSDGFLTLGVLMFQVIYLKIT